MLTHDLGCRIGAEISMCFCSEGSELGALVSASGLDAAGENGALAGEREFVAGVLAGGCGAAAPLGGRHDRTRAQTGRRVTHAVAASIQTPTGPAGALCAGFSGAPPNDPKLTLWVVESYARLAGLCLQDPGVLGGLLASAQRDGLTGCLTYASTRRTLIAEIERSVRHGLQLSCAFIDLDEFKLVNDRHGHVHGNRVLAVVAGELRRRVRAGDVVGRYGGDEFVAILPQTAEAGALVLARRLRAAIHSATLAFDDQPLGASIGVAQWTRGDSADDLLQEADRALLCAKRAGGGVAAASEHVVADIRAREDSVA